MQNEKSGDLEFSVRAGNSDRAVILLHGYGANQHDLAPLANVLDPKGLETWYFPNGILPIPQSPFYESRAWMHIDLNAYEAAIRTGRFREYMADQADQILPVSQTVAHWVEQIAAKHSHVALGGFSQGAILSFDVALTLTKTKIDRVLFLSGTLGCETRWKTALEMHTPHFDVFQSHGYDDPILPFTEAQRFSEMLKMHKLTTEFHPFAGGHEIPQEILLALRTFLKRDQD